MDGGNGDLNAIDQLHRAANNNILLIPAGHTS